MNESTMGEEKLAFEQGTACLLTETVNLGKGALPP